MLTSQNIKNYPFIKKRKDVWQEIVNYILNHLVKNQLNFDTCVEIGGGYCHFINNFPAKTKICYDLNPVMKSYANSDVVFRAEDDVFLNGLSPHSIDLFFASNFFEHLSYDQLKTIIDNIYNSLAKNGNLVLIQPNYRLCKENYFDDETHLTIFDDKSICTFLQSNKFRIVKLIPNFLPLTMNSYFPKSAFLAKLYMISPFRPFAGQMFIHAQKG